MQTALPRRRAQRVAATFAGLRKSLPTGFAKASARTVDLIANGAVQPTLGLQKTTGYQIVRALGSALGERFPSVAA